MASHRLTEDAIRESAHRLYGIGSDFDPLMNAIGESRFVLIGEASHGTHDFYLTRAQITQQLIEEKGFSAVVVEADWPDAYRVNRYVRGASDDPDADSALSSFKRFPTWMWRNRDVLDFVAWLRLHNDAIPRTMAKCGFYGMDLYSLYGSIAAVLEYLDKTDPAAARRARDRYACFEQYGDPQAYGYAASLYLDRSCENDTVGQLVELQRYSADVARRDGIADEDEAFFAEQNARLIRNAERYYRTMFADHASSWNLRDQHMAETIEALTAHLDRQVGRAKLVVWAHNSHLGDARATEVSQSGELNVGQLVRQRWGRECFNIGFTTYRGTVTAAPDWDASAHRYRVNPGLHNSYERLFHDIGLDRALLLLRDNPELATMPQPLLERAIGVIYRPQTERMSHYFHANLREQFDAVIHYDMTSAVEPLEWVQTWAREEEAFPTGL